MRGDDLCGIQVDRFFHGLFWGGRAVGSIGVKKNSDRLELMMVDLPASVALKDNNAAVPEVYSVPGDVCLGTGGIDASVDVHIAGTINNNVSVRSTNSVSVEVAVEAATVEAGEDVVVRGGIIQRGKGSIRAGRDIVAKFCEEADLFAGGNIKIAEEVMNCRVQCAGKLLTPDGIIIGGRIYAREGIEAATVGSEANVSTELFVGVFPEVLEEIERRRKALEQKRALIERVRNTVGPLMANLKRLTSSQKERATELMFQADSDEAEVAVNEVELAAMLKTARAVEVPYVNVALVIHRGTAIRIGRRTTLFTSPLRGPIRIDKRKIRSAIEFVAVNQSTGSVTVLPSVRAAPQTSVKAGERLQQKTVTSDGSSR